MATRWRTRRRRTRTASKALAPSPAKAGEGRRFVGWVERSETHRPPCNQASRAMGFASLYPSYGRPPGGLPRSGRPAHNAVSRTARSRPMRHLPLAALATAVLGLSGCTWVHMAPGAKAVQVMATAPTGCEKRGEVSVSVADKVRSDAHTTDPPYS